MVGSSPSASLPATSDPAVYLHSEPDLVYLPSSCNDSDDLDALHTLHAEAIAATTKLGVVIQHRAWKLPEAFRSDEDHQIESPCTEHKKSNITYRPKSPNLPSSPPIINMPLLSSPVTFPPSSSPAPMPNTRKRPFPDDLLQEAKRRELKYRRSGDVRKEDNAFPVKDSSGSSDPLRDFIRAPSRNVGPFIEDDDEVEDEPRMLAMLQSISKRTVTPQSPKLPEQHLLMEDSPQESYDISSRIRTSSGKSFSLMQKKSKAPISYERLIASRSDSASGKAKKSFYGIDIHDILDEATKDPKPVSARLCASHGDPPQPTVESQSLSKGIKAGRTLMWTEKYRAKKFTDLVGDERTHRNVLRWLKGWDPIVFPGTSKLKPKVKLYDDTVEDRSHRKILLLTGPPGLGKTTLAHVCAKQAGYEVVEINASDERSQEIVKGKIRNSVGTENVKGVNTKTTGGNIRKAGRPVCVIVDEVDGAVGGSSGGEGGFIKALVDLIILDQKNSSALGSGPGSVSGRRQLRKGDRFRLLRPIILICNDVYHPSLKLLRTSTMAEVVHIRKPPLDKVVARLKTVFEKEGIASDGDGVRRLCEAAWGISNRRESRSNSSSTGEGDMRGVLVVAEWVASKLRTSGPSSSAEPTVLTRKWVEKHMLDNLSYGGDGARGLGRCGAKEVSERVFLDGAGFPKTTASASVADLREAEAGNPLGVSELSKRRAMERLRDIVDTSGEPDRIVTDCFAAYPSHSFQDDTFLSKPNAAYDWLHFHDCLSSKVYSGQEWELGPYLSQSVLGFHHLFASSANHSYNNDQKHWSDDKEEETLPFTGLRADFEAYEAQRDNRAVLLGLQSALSPALLRSFRSAEDIATDLVPHLLRILTPDVKPVVVGGSGEQRGTASVRKEGEREMVQRAVHVMSGVGVIFERRRIETGQSGTSSYMYRMEPPLDTLATFETATQSGPATAPARFAIRQVLDQEYQKYIIRQRADARQARYGTGNRILDHDVDSGNMDKENVPFESEWKKPKVIAAKRDFFGRIINEARPRSKDECGLDEQSRKKAKYVPGEEEVNKVWVSFHEGFSNAVRKPITLDELMRGL